MNRFFQCRILPRNSVQPKSKSSGEPFDPAQDKLCQTIEKPKWLILLIMVFVFVVAGTGARAQQVNKVPRIGYLALPKGPSWPEQEFLQGLRDLGYVEGHRVIQWA